MNYKSDFILIHCLGCHSTKKSIFKDNSTAMNPYSIIFIIPIFIYLLALASAIIKLKVKKTWLTVVTFICTAICIALVIVIYSLKYFTNNELEFQITSISLLLFLLLQYQCNQAKTLTKYRQFYVLKSFFLIQIFGFLFGQLINSILNSELRSTLIFSDINTIFRYTFFVFYVLILTFIGYRYLKVARPPAQLKNIFIETFLMLTVINVLTEVFQVLIMFSHLQSFNFLNFTYLITTFAIIFSQLTLAAGIASAIYNKKADKISS